jgi:DNA repair exonuclease SbcCD ATPase subunit
MPMITNEIIFGTQVVSIIGFLVALFVLYRLLVEQKDATIQLQKENIAYLKDQLADAKAQSPDVLAQSLTNRVNLLEGELKRLEQDKSSTHDQIKAKEAELTAARTKAEELTKQVLHARTLLKDFLCPYCGAPLAEKAYHSESVEYQGRELDVDHEYMAFECGYEIVDGEVRGQCRTMNTGPVS